MTVNCVVDIFIALPQQLWLFAGIRACRQHAKAKLAKTLEVSDPGPAACQQCWTVRLRASISLLLQSCSVTDDVEFVKSWRVHHSHYCTAHVTSTSTDKLLSLTMCDTLTAECSALMWRWRRSCKKTRLSSKSELQHSRPSIPHRFAFSGQVKRCCTAEHRQTHRKRGIECNPSCLSSSSVQASAHRKLHFTTLHFPLFD